MTFPESRRILHRQTQSLRDGIGCLPGALEIAADNSSEGTFGVDYMPWYSQYSQHWYHGQNQQGGEGQYEADHRVNPLDDFWGFGPRRRAFPRQH